MIATLEGKLDGYVEGMAVIAIAGVGYGVHIASQDFSAKNGESVKLFIYEHIKEDAHTLFGFNTLESRALFTQLLSVSGVGPKLALVLMRSSAESALRQAIASANSAVLQAIPGVGKRTAERIVVELKDKVGEVGLATVSTENETVIDALMSLGYSRAEAAVAASKVPQEGSEQERLKSALGVLSRD